MTEPALFQSLDTRKDPRPARGGWEPGDYFVGCTRCRRRFIGSKRARTCAPCAYGDDQPRPGACAGQYTDVAKIGSVS